MKSAVLLVALLALLMVTACGSGSSPTLNVSGQWQFTTSPGSAGTITLNQQGTQLTGSMSETDYINTQITGTLAGDSLTATITAAYDGPDQCLARVNPVTINLSGTVAADGNSMSGQFTEHTGCPNSYQNVKVS
ncbi:MAG TPA: hypothetical protein VL240_11905 [Candidatus Binatia bacterium]|nr:hypothetical protein [Candidatus Binatia bacterium]